MDFEIDIATLAWYWTYRQGQPSLFQGTTAAGAAQVQSRHLSKSSSHSAPRCTGQSVGGRSDRSVAHGPFFPGRGKTSKGKFGCLSSLHLFPLPPSTPPLDSAAHHIATRQIRASCSISTVPTLVNSAIMGAEKDGSPAVPLRTAQTLNSTVVWAVSEAPNISRPFTNSLGRGARYTLRSCSAYLSRKQHLGGSTNRRATRKGWAGLGWAGLG